MSTSEISSGHLKFSALIDNGRRLLLDGNQTYLDAKIDINKLCSILYTSGTTGTSKGVMLSHRNITSVIVGGLNNIEIQESVLSVLPVHHSYEAVCGIFAMLYNGSIIYINENGFIMRLSAFKDIGAYPLSISNYNIDFTPVNQCAEAVVKIVINNDNNRIYHMYNNNTVNLKHVLNAIDKSIKALNDEEFFNLVLKYKDNKNVSVLMFYLDEFSKLKNNGAVVRLNNDKTTQLLASLDFSWSKITNEYINLFNKIATPEGTSS